MRERVQQDLVETLRDRAGDGLKAVVYYTERESTIVEGESWFEEYLAATDTRSPDEMHRDGVHRLQQADLSGDLYDADVHAEVTVTDAGTGLYLFPNGYEGVFVWFGPDPSIEIPTVVDESMAVLDDG